MVKDLRQSKSPKTTKSLRDLCSAEDGGINSGLGERKGGETKSVERGKRSLGKSAVRELGESVAGKLIKVGSHPAFRPTQGLSLLFNAGGVPRSLAARKVNLSASAQARLGLASPDLSNSLGRPRINKRKSEGVVNTTRMVGGHDVRGRDERVGAGVFGPYHRDRGAAGAGRGWGGRESSVWRDGAQWGDYRGGHPERLGAFGRGRAEQYPSFRGPSRGGPMEPKPGRWVWQEDGLQAHAQGKGVVAGKLSEDKGGAAELMEGMDVDISMEAEEGRDGDVAGRGNGRCSRCSKKGHAAGDCNAEVYCVICDSQDHMNHKFPLLKAPRPVAHAAGYAVMGLGFYHIPHPPLPRTKKDSKMARVSVMGGSLSADQLVLQLRRVVPVKWNWELKEVGEGEFLTQFPSKSELHRSIAYGRADAKGEGVPEGIRMQFEEWHEKEAFCYPRCG